jgi:predicted XRE-type DNA-binding protein
MRPFGVITARWAYGHPQKLIDWAYRATHLTALFAKEMIGAYYGSGPRRSYFQGCSDGGHEGLMEAMRYPADFDGIIIGAPASPWTRTMADLNLMLRSKLMSAICQMARGMTRPKAAKRFGITQPRVNDLLRGKVDKFSLDALVSMVPAAGLHVQIRVRKVG